MFWTATFFMLVTRFGIGLSDFSGKYNPKPAIGAPWGDLECHRTWFMITTNYTSDLWYADTPLSNTTYWPLDYPPLCAYLHHYVGKIVRFDFGVEVFRILPTDKQGAGHLGSGWSQDEEYIMVMRLIPAIAELVVFAPALWFFLITYNKGMSDKKNVMIWFAVMMAGPAMFVDHGHY